MKQKIGIIISMFPELHETFIVRELDALDRHQLDFEIYSLQYPRDPVTIDAAKRLMNKKTHYSPLLGLPQVSAFFSSLIRHPIKMLTMIGQLTLAGLHRPKELLKSFAILPITFHFGKIMKEKGIQHVHGHWANVPTTACWMLAQVEGFTWSAAIHGEDIFSKNKLLEKKLSDAKFTVVCTGFFCNHLKDKMNHSHPADIHLNYHGLDPKVWERIESSPPYQIKDQGPKTLLTIGRLVSTKGHDDLLRASKQLIDKGADIKVRLIGSGPEEGPLKALADKLDISERVEFLGMMAFEDVMTEIQNADTFVLACRMVPGAPPDGIPNVLAEAMAFGVPVISTNVSAIPELITDGEEGLLVPSNDPDSLANAINRIIEDTHFAKQLSDNAQNKVSAMFDQHKNINELLDYFEHYVGDVRPKSQAAIKTSVSSST